MRRKLIKALLVASMISIFHVVPARGQTTCLSNIAIRSSEMVNRLSKEVVDTYNKTYIRYATESLNIRKRPDADSKIVGSLRYGQKVQVCRCNNKWAILIRHGKRVGFVSKKYLSKEEPNYRLYWIPEYSGYKSFMDYQKITDESSSQWHLQQDAYTGDYGIRMVDGRFCVAIGFAFDPKIGQYFDLVLENGTVIPCIISDEKKHEDTVDDMYTADNGCYTEFVIDIDSLYKTIRTSGDVSSVCEGWDSPVKNIKMYQKNVLK